MKKLASIAAAVAAAPVLVSGVAFADSPGDLAGGNDIYQVRNIKSNVYGNTASVGCNETVKYSVKLSNTDYGMLSDIFVKAPLSGTMNASAKTSEGSTTTTSGTVTVTATSGTLTYQAGSAKLVDLNGNLIKNLSDGITTSGINVGDLKGSTREFVQFQADVKCPTTPPVTPPTTPPTTPNTPVTPETPSVLPNTGAGNVVGIAAGVMVAGFVAGRLYLSRKLARQN